MDTHVGIAMHSDQQALMARAQGRVQTDALSQLRPERESGEDKISPRYLGPRD